MDENHLRAVVPHEFAPLFAHGIRHDDDDLVAAHRPHERKPDPLVAARGLDDDGIGRKKSLCLGVKYHIKRSARFYRAADVEPLKFHEDLGIIGSRHIAKPYNRRVAYCFEYRVANHIIKPSI